ncbi:MAG: hypothetical protein AB1585_08235 [Thermodesulfobacteriota bacterium]
MLEVFVAEENYALMEDFLKAWTDDARRVKEAFIRLKTSLALWLGVSFSFHSRPGVSHSFRAFWPDHGEKEGRLVGLIDIVDDDPENRWLSVCFYSDTVSDPEEAGNLLPGGLLGEDGYCFDLFEYDEGLLSYLEERIDEAFTNSEQAVKEQPGGG